MDKFGVESYQRIFTTEVKEWIEREELGPVRQNIG